MASAVRPRGRGGRWWRWPLYFVLSLLVLLALLFVALQTSLAREQIRTQVNHALVPLFQGKIQIERIGRVSLWGVRGVDARIFDPQRRQVIRAQGLSAWAWLPSLAWQLPPNHHKPEIDIANVHVDFADVTLREDEELGVTLGTTFLPPKTGEPKLASAADAGPRLHIGHITFD